MTRMRRQSEAGFTMIEMAVVIGLIVIITGMAVIQISGALPTFRANAAQDLVVAQMRIGREMAVAQRRRVQLLFVHPNQIQLERLNQPLGQTFMDPVFFEGGVIFQVFAGVPDTPAGFGNNSSIYIGGKTDGPTQMAFHSDGTFNDEVSGLPVNGTVFVGIPNLSGSARAVTILGQTGRVRPYHWNGTAWIE